MPTSHLELGRQGEELAVKYLKSQGYQIVATNCTIILGRNLRRQPIFGELDIIAYDANILCFIEVKTRVSEDFASPEQAVDQRKQRQLIRVAQRYRQLMGIKADPYRFDVVAIVQSPASTPTIRLSKSFFKNNLEQKRAYSWHREI